ncbi:hypothetical protein [Kribbella sp. NPDC006257]|uniref:6-phosphogluconolactonase n=1 Tax=Kribbella sp. NPDC006257 TaxID=3156738 RepID=UPI0033ABF0D4
MEINTVPSLGEPVGSVWRDLQARHIASSGTFNYALPLSSTPRPIYSWAIKNHARFAGWDSSRFVLMDEQVDGTPPAVDYIPAVDSASYESFARTHLLSPLDAATGAETLVLKPDLQKFSSFDAPINMLVLALGVQGNYANVMPGTPLDVGWHLARLIEEFRQVHTESSSESYAGARFREYGMSLGPWQVRTADQVIVIVSGARKRDLYAELMSHKSPDPDFPLSIIFHPEVRDRVSVFVTEDVVAEAG